jgi:hypothetical protein
MTQRFIETMGSAQAFLGIQDGGPNSFRHIPFQVVGGPENRANENIGSLIILWYATLKNLTVGETLPLFGEHFDAVIEDPDGTKHANIRALMKHDRDAYTGSLVVFSGEPVVPRT